MATQQLQELRRYFQHYITQLKNELLAFPDEALIWETTGSITNSAGNLTLHIAGNLQHFIGHVLGKSNYIRNRNFEFEAKNLSVEALIEELTIAEKVIEKVLSTVTQADLDAEFPITFSHEPSSVYFNLLRFLTHLSYHVGQVNYLRRSFELSA